MPTRLIIKSILYTLLLPGIVVVLIPFLILDRSATLTIQIEEPLSWLAAAGWVISLAILLSSIWNFAAEGEGTLAPIDPPKRLVITGLFCYTRNPMYLGVISALVFSTILFLNLWLGLYSLIVFVLFHLFVVYYEEPALRAKFGTEYEEYQMAVPRWGLRIKPYKG